ncbi:hypothetical protein MKW92_004651 [Papaver armeniacum]|nr:hypothetical protein MKW92_004651 [Papaver armeniacum]
MEMNSAVDEHEDPMISSFLKIVVGQSVHTAIQYLQETHWVLEDAIELFFSHQVVSCPEVLHENNNNGEANIRAEIMEHPDVLAVDNFEDYDNGLSLELMYHGPFHEAKQAAEAQDRWLIVNVQSKDVYNSYALNMHTWAQKTVSQTIVANFIFWQVYDNTIEGQKVCNYYKAKVKSWSGMIKAVQLLEDLSPFMYAGPKHQHAQFCGKRPTETSQQTTVPETTEEEDEQLRLAILASMENMTAIVAPACANSTDEPSLSKKLAYPDLPEEPKVEKTLLCRIGVRLPDGRRIQRNFLLTDPVQLLWSFCNSHLDKAQSRPFHLTQAIPGASKTLDYESKRTFEESGLSNSMISVTWD